MRLLYNDGLQLRFDTDQFGRLTCRLSDAGSEAIVTASNMPSAKTDLARAVSAAIHNGLGECIWMEACGEYRWVFRRENNRIRTAVLWSTGTATGWEHVFWSECDADVFAQAFQQLLEPAVP